MTDEEAFEVLKTDHDYEIGTEYPHPIRRIGKTNNISEWVNNNGYIQCKVNGKIYSKHRLIALQFIENNSPETKTQIDHINRIQTDNRIENLRWCTYSENNLNKEKVKKQSPEFIDELPENVHQINEYNGAIYNRYYYDYVNEKIILKTESKKFKIIKSSPSRKQFTLYDINGERHLYCEKKFLSNLKKLFSH